MIPTTPLSFIQNMNAPEIIMIAAVILLFFGAKRLPELCRSVGKSMGEFKRAKADIENDIRSAMEAEPEVVRAPAHPPKTDELA
jgi:sec-independent protein translocase protein TatA